MKGVGTQGLGPLVPVTGIEPVRDSRLIGFSYYSMSPQPLTRCSLDSIFTISYDLGGWCIVSTHYALLHIGTVFPIRFHRLANFYSKGFPLRHSLQFPVVPSKRENRSKSKASASSATPACTRHIIFNYYIPKIYVISSPIELNCCMCLYYWLPRWDSNPGLRFRGSGFRDRRVGPLHYGAIEGELNSPITWSA